MRKIYVKNEDNLIYEVVKKEKLNNTYDCYTLELLCGIDYINSDSDIQAYVSCNRFIEDIQCEMITVNSFEECLVDRLLEEGFSIVDKLPKIYNDNGVCEMENLNFLSNGDMLEKLIDSNIKKEIIKKYELYNNESFLRVLNNEYVYLNNITNKKDKDTIRLNKVNLIINLIENYL